MTRTSLGPRIRRNGGRRERAIINVELVRSLALSHDPVSRSTRLSTGEIHHPLDDVLLRASTGTAAELETIIYRAVEEQRKKERERG